MLRSTWIRIGLAVIAACLVVPTARAQDPLDDPAYCREKAAECRRMAQHERDIAPTSGQAEFHVAAAAAYDEAAEKYEERARASERRVQLPPQPSPTPAPRPSPQPRPRPTPPPAPSPVTTSRANRMIASLAARQESFEQTLDALERDLFGHSDRARRAADFRRSIEERLHQIERLQESGRAVPDDAWSDIPDEAPGLDERIGEAFATGEDWRTALTTIPDPPLPVVNDSPAPKEAVDSATELPTTGPWRDGVTGLIEFPGRAGRSTFESPPRSLESLVASLEGTSGASFRRESVGGAIEGILGEPSPLSPGAWLRSPPFAVTTERALASTNLPSVTATDAASIEQLEDDLWDWADPKNLWRLTWPFRGSRALRGIWIYGSGLIDRFSSLFDFSLKELTDDSR